MICCNIQTTLIWYTQIYYQEASCRSMVLFYGVIRVLRSCRYCGRIHDIKYICPKKPKKKRKQYDTEAVEFRRTNAWKKKSLDIRERDHYLCQVCIRAAYMTYRPLTHHDISVHHIIPISEDKDLALDDENLITLCAFHHELAESGQIPRSELQKIVQETTVHIAQNQTPGGLCDTV